MNQQRCVPRTDGWVPWKSWPTTGVCVCGAKPKWSNDGQLRCDDCVPLTVGGCVHGSPSCDECIAHDTMLHMST